MKKTTFMLLLTLAFCFMEVEVVSCSSNDATSNKIFSDILNSSENVIANNASSLGNFGYMSAYILTLEANPRDGGSLSGQGRYTEGDEVELSATANEGYEFVYWMDAYGNTISMDSDFVYEMPFENTTLTAVFDKKEYNMTVSIKGGGVEANFGEGTHSIEFTDEITISAKPNEGWSFTHWEGDIDSRRARNSEVTLNMPANDLNITANFERQKFNLAVDIKGEGSESNFGRGRHSIKFDESVTLEAKPNRSWRFTGWTGDVESDEDKLLFNMPAKDVAVIANFEFIQTYVLSLSADPIRGGILSGGGRYEEGEKVEVNATTNEGYAFSNWTDEEGNILSEKPKFEYTMADEEITLIANFETANNLTLSAEPSEGGDIEGSGSYVQNEKIEIIAEASEGYRFVNWTGDTEYLEDANAVNTIVNMPGEDISLNANFERKEYELVISVYGQGSEGNFGEGTQSVKFNESISLKAVSEGGWMFQKWDGFKLSENKELNFNMPAESIEVYLYFLQEIICGEPFYYHGYYYETVKIGNQCWFKENLRTTKYTDGSKIRGDLPDDEWSNTNNNQIGAYAVYDHNHADAEGLNSRQEVIEAYGKLYNWYAVDDERGLCPYRWRVSSDDDWKILEGTVDSQHDINDDIWNEITWRGEDAGKKLKNCRTENHPLGLEAGDCNVDNNEHPRWDKNDDVFGTDDFGFSALPGGIRSTGGGYFTLGRNGRWWVSDEESQTHAWSRFLTRDRDAIFRNNYNKVNGYSVRCVIDVE